MKKSEKRKEYLYIGAVAAAIVVAAVCIFIKLHKAAKETDFSEFAPPNMGAVSKMAKAIEEADEDKKPLDKPEVEGRYSAHGDVGIPTESGSFIGVKDDNLLLNVRGTTTEFILEGIKVNDISPLSEKLKEKEKIYIEYDEVQKDGTGRKRAYLYFSDMTMIQEWMLENKYAVPDIKEDNVRYKDKFEKGV